MPVRILSFLCFLSSVHRSVLTCFIFSCDREFADHFCSLMVNTMTEAIKGGHVADDVLFEEVKSHALFCLEKAQQVIGKEEILDQV